MVARSLLALVALPALAAAHFQITYPPPRGTEDSGEASYPCAGFAVTQNRTTVSTSSIPVALDLEHDHSLISIFLAIGNDGANFNHQLQPTVQEIAPGDFCFPTVPVPANLNITDGTNATIQVITDGESGGGLYMCADITFTTRTVDALSPSQCSNSTGVTASVAAGTLANGTKTTGNGGGAATSTPAATNSATSIEPAPWGILVAGILGAVALP